MTQRFKSDNEFTVTRNILVFINFFQIEYLQILYRMYFMAMFPLP